MKAIREGKRKERKQRERAGRWEGKQYMQVKQNCWNPQDLLPPCHSVANPPLCPSQKKDQKLVENCYSKQDLFLREQNRIRNVEIGNGDTRGKFCITQTAEDLQASGESLESLREHMGVHLISLISLHRIAGLMDRMQFINVRYSYNVHPVP